MAAKFVSKLFQKKPDPVKIEAELSRSRDLVVVKKARLELSRALEELAEARNKKGTED